MGSCTACALLALVSYWDPKLIGSRLFLYYNERAKEGTIKIDSGAYLRDGVLSLMNYGVCPETEWPYNINDFAVRPPTRCYKEALKHQLLSYKHIP